MTAARRRAIVISAAVLLAVTCGLFAAPASALMIAATCGERVVGSLNRIGSRAASATGEAASASGNVAPDARNAVRSPSITPTPLVGNWAIACAVA